MIEITREKLKRIYNEHTNDKAAEILGITKKTLLFYIREAGIEQKGKGVTQRKLKITG